MSYLSACTLNVQITGQILIWKQNQRKFQMKKLSYYLPTANMFPNVNMTANLIGLTKTIKDCARELNVSSALHMISGA